MLSSAPRRHKVTTSSPDTRPLPESQADPETRSHHSHRSRHSHHSRVFTEEVAETPISARGPSHHSEARIYSAGKPDPIPDPPSQKPVSHRVTSLHSPSPDHHHNSQDHHHNSHHQSQNSHHNSHHSAPSEILPAQTKLAQRGGVGFEAELLDLPPQALTGPGVGFKYDLYDQRFVVSQMDKKLGSFTAQEVVKLMIDRTLEQQSNVSPVAQFLITNLIGEVDPRAPLSFRFHETDRSPFMADVESLIRLNNALHHFEKHELDEVLSRIPAPKKKERIERISRHFIYHLLHHTLKVLNQLGDQIHDDPEQKALRRSIAHYTVGIVYRISQFVKHEVKHYGSQVKTLNDNYSLVLQSRRSLGEKIDELSGKLDRYRERQETLTRLAGGGQKSSEPAPTPTPSVQPTPFSDHHEKVTKIMELESSDPYQATSSGSPNGYTEHPTSESSSDY